MRDPNLKNTTALCSTEYTQHAAGRSAALWLPAILMGVVGAVLLLFPMETGISFACLMAAGLLLYGISECVTFFRTAKGQRSGWTLTNGLLMFSSAGLFFWSAFGTPFGVLQMLMAMAFFAGFLSCSMGFSQITAFLHRQPEESSRSIWLLLGGIGNLILGMLAFLMPLLGWFTLATVWGAYLLASAVAAAVVSVSGSRTDTVA